MNNPHLNEQEIQLYAELGQGLGQSQLAHIDSCAQCSASAANYRLLFSQLQLAEKAAFDFDLNALVLDTLPAAQVPQKTIAWDTILVFIALAIIAIPLCIYGGFLALLFKGLSGGIAAIITASALAVIAGQCILFYRDYNKRLSLLHLNV